MATRLTEEQRADIARRNSKGESIKALAEEFGVAYGTAQAVVNKARKTQAHQTSILSAPTSELRELFFEIGWATIGNEAIPPDMAAKAKAAYDKAHADAHKEAVKVAKSRI